MRENSYVLFELEETEMGVASQQLWHCSIASCSIGVACYVIHFGKHCFGQSNQVNKCFEVELKPLGVEVLCDYSILKN